LGNGARLPRSVSVKAVVTPAEWRSKSGGSGGGVGILGLCGIKAFRLILVRHT
jgi:hypothetical protein